LCTHHIRLHDTTLRKIAGRLELTVIVALTYFNRYKIGGSCNECFRLVRDMCVTLCSVVFLAI